jgi:hypothetical protein
VTQQNFYFFFATTFVLNFLPVFVKFKEYFAQFLVTSFESFKLLLTSMVLLHGRRQNIDKVSFALVSGIL